MSSEGFKLAKTSLREQKVIYVYGKHRERQRSKNLMFLTLNESLASLQSFTSRVPVLLSDQHDLYFMCAVLLAFFFVVYWCSFLSIAAYERALKTWITCRLNFETKNF